MKKFIAFTMALLLAAAAWGGTAAAAVVSALAARTEDRMPAFGSFTGTIIDITETSGDPGRTVVTVENEDEARVNFILEENTFLPEGFTLEEGIRVTGFYDLSLPVPMIYPPQYRAVALVPDMAGMDVPMPVFVKMDRFDEDLISYDGMLRLNIGPDTEIILQSGREFELFGQTVEEALTNRAMLVFYTVSTRSIPALTTPSLIVVFYERAIHPPLVQIDPEDLVGTPPADEDLVSMVFPEPGTLVELVIENEIITEFPFAVHEDGMILVPLYLVANALDITLGWDGETQRVVVDGRYQLSIGQDEYTLADGSTISLGTAPVIIDDRTHVPLSFFREVMDFNNAWFHAMQVIIDNEERME